MYRTKKDKLISICDKEVISTTNKTNSIWKSSKTIIFYCYYMK